MSAKFSSAFGDMLDRNRSELDRLLGDRARPASASPLAPRQAPGASAVPAAIFDSDSPAVRLCNSRFGDAWRFQVVGQEREQDELVVTGRLSLLDRELSVTQTGRAAVGSSARSGTLHGSTDGISFMAGAGAPQTGNTGENNEQAALRQATETALANCLEWL